MKNRLELSFLSELMLVWFKQFDAENQSSWTNIGLFKWEFMLNRRNPDKPRRIPRIQSSFDLEVNSGRRKAIYFCQPDLNTLHVWQVSGYRLSGSSDVIEFILKEGVFIQTRILMRMII